MNTIIEFIESGVWDYREQIASIVPAIPLVIEGGTLAKNLYHNPSYLSDKAQEVKAWALHAFTPEEGEESSAAISRISRNIFISLVFTGITGAAVIGAALWLPSSMALPVALSTLIFMGKGACHVPQLVEQFKVRADHDPAEEKKRIALLAVKAALVLAALITTAVLVYSVAPELIYGDIFSISFPFPESELITFLEYAAVGVVHLGLAAHKYTKGNPKEALFHLFAGALGFIFPLWYWQGPEMRLHHSFTGLIMMAIPFRPIQILGSFITLDSSFYMMVDYRNSSDIMNVIDHYPNNFIGGYGMALATEQVNHSFPETGSV